MNEKLDAIARFQFEVLANRFRDGRLAFDGEKSRSRKHAVNSFSTLRNTAKTSC
jgi:hypothetical protein